MAKADFQEMVDAALPFAKRMLTECGEFIPFGVRLPRVGRAELIAGDVGDEHPRSEEVMSLLEGTLRRMAAGAQIRGGAVCFMGSVTRPGHSLSIDVATFRMAHIDSEMLDVYLPYKIEEGKVTFGDLFASRGTVFSLARPQ